MVVAGDLDIFKISIQRAAVNLSFKAADREGLPARCWGYAVGEGLTASVHPFIFSYASN
jgi:hypothetical protein